MNFLFWVRRLPDELSEAQRTLVFQIVLKVADLGHLTAPMPIHKASQNPLISVLNLVRHVKL